MKNAQRLAALIALTLIALAANTATATQGVSPGEADRLAQVNDSCPTFSWQGVPEAAQYEIVAYSLEKDEDPAETQLAVEAEVLYSQVPAGATSWTPSANQCFEPSGRYVWFVRAVTELIDDQVIEAGEWSAGRYFEVPAGPSAEDVARAVEVLKRWEAANGGGAVMVSSGTGTGTGASHRKGEGEGEGEGVGHRKAVPTASAAIRGEHPDTSGEVYGVVGASASYDGAGVAAANLDGGPDLVLDGSADGDVDTYISEDILTRSSPDDEIFLFHNGGGGALDLHVHGTLNGDGLNVQYGPVIDDNGNWLGVGDTVPCASCVTSSDIADGSIIDNDLATGSVSSNAIIDGTIRPSDLAVSSVTSEKIADLSITHVDLANGSVTSAKIADSTITSADMANGSVSSHAIIAGSIKTTHLTVNAVTSEKIADLSIISDDLAIGSVSSNAIIDGGIRTADLGGSIVTSAKIDDGTITGADIATGAVGAGQIADGSITSADIGSSQIGQSHILNMGVGTAELATGAVTTTKIEDGTITAADVDPTGGIYSSKTAVYEVTSADVLSPGECVAISPQCYAVVDLPLQGYCTIPSLRPIEVRQSMASDWATESAASSWTCEFCYDSSGSGPEFVFASILCIQVPVT